jgi:hypothetical protein
MPQFSSFSAAVSGLTKKVINWISARRSGTMGVAVLTAGFRPNIAGQSNRLQAEMRGEWIESRTKTADLRDGRLARAHTDRMTPYAWRTAETGLHLQPPHHVNLARFSNCHILLMSVNLLSLALTVVIAAVIAAAAFYATGHRLSGLWLLVLSPACLCVVILQDLSRGVRQIGQAAIESDHNQLKFCLALLALSLLAALRPSWPWLFWIAWTLNVLVCALLLYMVFFWKVFS